MKLFMHGRKYCCRSAEHSEACMLQYFLPQVNNFIITQAKSHDNSIISIYFMMKVLDNFHSPPMVVAPWVDYGNYPTLESLIE